jgi:hypothetical protein
MAAHKTDRAVGDDQVVRLTRGAPIAVIPFLVVAFGVPCLWPRDTGRLFAGGFLTVLVGSVVRYVRTERLER